MTPTRRRFPRPAAQAVALAAALSCFAHAAQADTPPPQRAIEQALAAASQDKKGIMLYVGGQTLGGAVTKLEAGQWVELRSQQYGRIVVRLDRIDAVAMP